MTDPTTPVRDPHPGTVEHAFLQPGREHLTEQLRRVVKPFAADYAYDIADAVLPVVDAAQAAAYRRGMSDAAVFVDNDDTCTCGGCDTCLSRVMAAELRRRAAAATFSAREDGEGLPRCFNGLIDAPFLPASFCVETGEHETHRLDDGRTWRTEAAR